MEKEKTVVETKNLVSKSLNFVEYLRFKACAKERVFEVLHFKKEEVLAIDPFAELPEVLEAYKIIREIILKKDVKSLTELMFPNIEHLPQEDQKKFYSDFVYINNEKVMKYTKPIKNAKTNFFFFDKIRQKEKHKHITLIAEARDSKIYRELVLKLITESFENTVFENGKIYFKLDKAPLKLNTLHHTGHTELNAIKKMLTKTYFFAKLKDSYIRLSLDFVFNMMVDHFQAESKKIKRAVDEDSIEECDYFFIQQASKISNFEQVWLDFFPIIKENKIKTIVSSSFGKNSKVDFFQKMFVNIFEKRCRISSLKSLRSLEIKFNYEEDYSSEKDCFKLYTANAFSGISSNPQDKNRAFPFVDYHMFLGEDETNRLFDPFKFLIKN